MREKRKTAAFVPYRREKDGFAVYLQRRDKNARRNPDLFCLFGGGMKKDESPEDAMLREIREELDFTPTNYRLFTTYQTDDALVWAFCGPVDENFESAVTVREGQYGRFFTEEAVRTEPLLQWAHKEMLASLFGTLRKKNRNLTVFR